MHAVRLEQVSLVHRCVTCAASSSCCQIDLLGEVLGVVANTGEET